MHRINTFVAAAIPRRCSKLNPDSGFAIPFFVGAISVWMLRCRIWAEYLAREIGIRVNIYITLWRLILLMPCFGVESQPAQSALSDRRIFSTWFKGGACRCVIKTEKSDWNGCASLTFLTLPSDA